VSDSGCLVQSALDGPAVRLRKAHVQTFALALHELAINARKYGALTTDHGRLNVTWWTYEADGEGPHLADAPYTPRMDIERAERPA
jgi:two-component sensor histidine kinase